VPAQWEEVKVGEAKDGDQTVPHIAPADVGDGGGRNVGGIDAADAAVSSERVAALEAQVASLTQQLADKQVAFEVSETQLVEQKTKNGVLMKKVVDVTMELTQTSDELKVKSAALSGSLTNATDLRQKLDTATADLTASRARVAELVAAKQEVDDELKRERLDQVEMETKINELQKKLDHAEYMQRVKEDQLMKARGDLTYANEEKRYKDSDIADLKRQLSELTLECQFKTDEKTRLEARDVQVHFKGLLKVLFSYEVSDLRVRHHTAVPSHRHAVALPRRYAVTPPHRRAALDS